MDLAIVEGGNGGDVQLLGNDLEMVFAGENFPYLGMFGGNPGFITKNKVTEEQSFDWWGNNLLMPSNQSIQFNSLFEKALSEVALTSSGRIALEEAIKKDLTFMRGFANVFVSVSITDVDRVQVKIKITQNDGSIKIKIINFRKTADGDFSIQDFNDDFFV